MRSVETALARFTLGALVLYFPVETWASLPHGLWHPMYLVDLAAMGLLLFGALYSLRARPDPGAGPLCAAYAWAAANGWRGAAWRWIDALENQGRRLDHGAVELWVVTLAAGVALALFGLSMALLIRSGRALS